MASMDKVSTNYAESWFQMFFLARNEQNNPCYEDKPIFYFQVHLTAAQV